MPTYEPKVVCFSCKFSWGYLGDQEELSRRIKNWVPIICTGKVDTIHILNAYKQGADGVLILGCPEGHCHYQDGNFEMRKRVHLLYKVLKDYGIERERLQLSLSLDTDGKTMPMLVKQMSDSIRALAPLKNGGVQSEKTVEAGR